MPNTELRDFADLLLETVEARFTTAGVVLPERRFTHTGEIAFDCPQLVVSFIRIFNGQPGAEIAGSIPCAMFRSAEFQVLLTRCVPIFDEAGEPPTPEELSSAANEIAVDAYVLFNGLVEAYREGVFSACGNLAIGSVEAVGPDGGAGGVVCTVTVQV